MKDLDPLAFEIPWPGVIEDAQSEEWEMCLPVATSAL